MMRKKSVDFVRIKSFIFFFYFLFFKFTCNSPRSCSSLNSRRNHHCCHCTDRSCSKIADELEHTRRLVLPKRCLSCLRDTSRICKMFQMLRGVYEIYWQNTNFKIESILSKCSRDVERVYALYMVVMTLNNILFHRGYLENQ